MREKNVFYKLLKYNTIFKFPSYLEWWFALNIKKKKLILKTTDIWPFTVISNTEFWIGHRNEMFLS